MKSKLNSNKYVITRPCQIRTMLLMQCYAHFDSFLPSNYRFGTVYTRF